MRGVLALAAPHTHGKQPKARASHGPPCPPLRGEQSFFVVCSDPSPPFCGVEWGSQPRRPPPPPPANPSISCPKAGGVCLSPGAASSRSRSPLREAGTGRAARRRGVGGTGAGEGGLQPAGGGGAGPGRCFASSSSTQKMSARRTRTSAMLIAPPPSEVRGGGVPGRGGGLCPGGVGAVASGSVAAAGTALKAWGVCVYGGPASPAPPIHSMSPLRRIPSPDLMCPTQTMCIAHGTPQPRRVLDAPPPSSGLPLLMGAGGGKAAAVLPAPGRVGRGGDGHS